MAERFAFGILRPQSDRFAVLGKGVATLVAIEET
jgi:hypothetical protein